MTAAKKTDKPTEIKLTINAAEAAVIVMALSALPLCLDDQRLPIAARLRDRIRNPSTKGE